MIYTITFDEEKRTMTVELPDGRKGSAKCCPTDAFDFGVGFALACERAKHKRLKPEPKPEEPKKVKVPKLKVGDRVRFKTWTQMKQEYGMDVNGNISTPAIFTKDMAKLCSIYATVSGLRYSKYRGTNFIELTAFSKNVCNPLDYAYDACMFIKVSKDK